MCTKLVRGGTYNKETAFIKNLQPLGDNSSNFAVSFHGTNELLQARKHT